MENQSKNEQLKGYVESLTQFKKHMETTVESALEVTTNPTLNSIKIEFEGESISIPTNADSYTRLLQFLNDEIVEAKELNSNNEIDLHLDVSAVGRDWVRILTNEGYEFLAKTFNFPNKQLTVVIDNFSVEPISLHAYSLIDILLVKESHIENLMADRTIGWDNFYDGLQHIKNDDIEIYKDVKLAVNYITEGVE